MSDTNPINPLGSALDGLLKHFGVTNEYHVDVKVPGDEDLSAKKMDVGFLPIDHIVVNGIVIRGDQIQAHPFHDIDDGTLSVTFVGVRDLQVVYKGDPHPSSFQSPHCTCPPVEGHPLTPRTHHPGCPLSSGGSIA